MELLDILDNDGKPTGRTIERGGLFKSGEYYLGVHVYIVNSAGKFLIQKRADCKRHYPGIWDINMGHVLAGETSIQAVIREIYEEIGTKLEKDELKFIKRFIWEEYNHMVDLWLVYKDIDIDSGVLQPDEVSDIKYVSRPELMELLTDTSKDRPFRPDDYIDVVRAIQTQRLE